MDEDMQRRIRRIYAAIQETEDNDISHYLPLVMTSEKALSICQDWRGGMTYAQIENVAHTAIHNVANLFDHLRQWAVQSGKGKQLVDDAASGSPAIQIIRDLSNNDKHGYPPRNGGYSKRGPRLRNTCRVLRLSTAHQARSYVSVFLTPNRAAQTAGSGSAKVLITGQVVDSDDKVVGDLHSLLAQAVSAWESLLDIVSPGWRIAGGAG